MFPRIRFDIKLLAGVPMQGLFSSLIMGVRYRVAEEFIKAVQGFVFGCLESLETLLMALLVVG